MRWFRLLAGPAHASLLRMPGYGNTGETLTNWTCQRVVNRTPSPTVPTLNSWRPPAGSHAPDSLMCEDT